MRTPMSSSGIRRVRAGIVVGAVATIIVASAATPALAAAATLTLSSTAGSSSGGNTITASSTAAAAYLSGITTPVAVFSMPACPLTYTSAASTPVTPSSLTVGNVSVVTVNKVSNTKASILVPALAVVPALTAISARYNLCIYASVTAASALVGSSTYTIAVAPAITTGAVVPASGPALGGSTIIVSGTTFPTTAGSISGTLGGNALTSVTPINATSFSAVTPPHGPGFVTLNMTTAAGTQTLTNAFNYANGVTVSPNTAPGTSTAMFIDVTGAGFLNDPFGVGATDARVWLVSGKYTPATSGTTYTTGPSAECATPVTISDSELICSLNLVTGALTPSTAAALNSQVADGTYTMTVVSDGGAGHGAAANYLQTDISSGSTFTVGPY